METESSVQQDMRARIPLYIAGLGVSCMGIVALGIVTADSTLALLMSILVAAGFGMSWRVRAGTLAKHFVQIIVLVILVSALVVVFAMPTVKYLFLPAGVHNPAELVLACLLAWLMVIHSFTLVTDKAVLFMCVPSLSLVSLAATLGPSAEVLVYFAILLVLACFILIQQNALSDPRPPGRRGDLLRFQGDCIRWQVGLALSVTLTAILVGLVSCKLLYPHLERLSSSRFLAHAVAPIIQQFVEENFVPVAAGQVSLGEHQVMMVRCKKPLLWRSRTFNFYMGHGWSNNLIPEELVIPPAEKARSGFAPPMPRSQTSRANTFRIPGGQPTEVCSAARVDQLFFRIMLGRSNAIFAAAEPKTVRLSAYEPLIKSGGGLRLNEYYGWGMSYEVESLVRSAKPKQLRAASDDYPKSVREQYLEVPQSCWRVEKLAKQVTAGQTNAYDKAVAIQRYLEANCRYDANAPAVPGNEDVVSHFLFKSRRGYCDVFASAIVIMCRSVGIPARWVMGFATGEFDPSQNAFRVRAKDSHAWAELYFPGYGWIEFDPAPSDGGMSLAAGIRRFWAGVNRVLAAHRLSTVAGGLILLLVGYLLKVELIGRMRAARGPSTAPSAPGAGTVEYYRRMCILLSRFGYPRDPAATPLEYAAELEHSFGSDLGHLSAAVGSLTAAFVECRYSGREPSGGATAGALGEMENLLRFLKAAKKQKLLHR